MSTEQKDALSDAESARLEALLQDRTLSAQSALVKENARLHLDNKHLKKQNLRVWTTFGIQSVGMIMVVGAAFWWFPKYRFIPTTDNKAICEVNAQDNVQLTPAAVQEFAADAAIASYTYDYINYRTIIAEVGDKWYTFNGRKGYQLSLDQSSNLERVVKGRLILRAYKTNAPQLESEGLESGHRVWFVHVPLAIEYYVGGSPAPTSTQDFLAEVKVIETQATAANTKGTGVDSIVLRPRTRVK